MPSEQQCQIALHFDSSCDRRRYQAPDASVNEIAVILPGDGDQPTGPQDIILYRKHGPPLQRISNLHPFYPSLRYVLLFSTGQLGWYPHLPYHEREEGSESQQKYVTMAEFFHYRLYIHPRDVESNHLFLAGKLFQEFVCEAWAVAEQSHLSYIRMNQAKLRVEVYKGLADAVAANVDASWNELQSSNRLWIVSLDC